MFACFVIMWACTPSSLRRDNNKEVTKAVADIAMPDSSSVLPDVLMADTTPLFTEALPDVVSQVQQAIGDIPADSLVAKADSLVTKAETLVLANDTLAQLADTIGKRVKKAIAKNKADSTETAQVIDKVVEAAGSVSVPDVPTSASALDSLIKKSGLDAAVKMKRDTTTMDSLELAIFKHNKAVDDSLTLDSLNRQKKNGIDAPVKYTANDSLTYEAASGRAHLYGDSHVEYQNMDLKSEKIYMVLDSSLVHATGIRDSVSGKLDGTPIFKMGSDTYESDTMAFNFKTKKGLITQVYTQQEDGFLTSELSKRGGNGELFLQHGRYTTCDEPHPDFYIAMSRAKVRPGKDVVFGPAYLVVCDVPLPLAVPYGFFPFTKSYSSGFIMPTYGDETERGFYLRDGGYYFAVSDKMDLKLIGEIYTKGSWGLTTTSNYRKRYKFSGSFLASYQNTINGEKNMPDYTKQTSFKVSWTHRQDAKANPYSNLSASVNFATSSYERNNLTSMYNPQSMTQSTRTSSVAYSTGFSSLNMSISTSMNLSQNMRDSTISLSLPQLSLTISKFYPFRRKKMVGKERWYEKISMNYSGNFSNSISTKEDKLLHSDFQRDWNNSMKHSIPISASFTIMNYINVTPSFNFSDITSFKKAHKSWNETTQKEVTDTLTGIYNIYNWSMNMSMSTTLYGFYIPSRKLFGNKIDRIRHVLSPSLSFSFAPDFSASRYGYYDTYQKTDKDGNVSLVEYSPYRIGSVSPPGKGRTGSIALALRNNLEMKVRDSNDSLKKVSLIDDFSANMSYNLATKIRPLSALSTSLRLKLTKSYTFNLSAVFSSYVYEADSVGATPHESETVTYWEKGKIGRFQGMSQNLSYTLSNDKIANLFKWLRGEKTEKKNVKEDTKDEDEDEIDIDTNIDKDMEKAKHGAKKENAGKAETDDDGYMTFNVPWSISFGYGITMRENTDKSKFNYNTMRYPYMFTQNLNVSGNIRISDGWNISFSSGYDFENKKISMTTASLSRDLHCFSMSCSVVLAPYASYNFSFRCNASTLTDALKYDKRSGYSNSVQWY